MDNSVWPPPPTNQIPPVISTSPPFSWRVLLSALGFGLALGFIDIHLTASDDSNGLIDKSYMVGSGLFGFLQPKTFVISALLLTFSLYIVHVVAIMNGVSALYVEKDTDHALYCLVNVSPNFVCALAGATVKFIWNRKNLIFRKR